MPLTDTAIRNLKSVEKPFKLTDGSGLHLLVQPHGAKLWRMAYRFAGKQKTLALGAYPIVSLADARARRDEARKLLSNGVDPSRQRKVDKHIARTKVDFRPVADEWLEKLKREGRATNTLKKTKWLLSFLYADIGSCPIGDITAPELLRALRKIEARGRYETAVRARGVAGAVFRYAIATGRADRDPSSDLHGALTAPKVKHRAAILSPPAIGALLRSIDAYEGQSSTRIALQLAALLFVRPGELRMAEWHEFDLATAEWRIPAHRMKMRRVHRVPLSRQALKLLEELKNITGHLRYLFPSVRTTQRPISENTLNGALRRLGYGPDEMTTHGFRAMAATRLNEMGQWTPDAIERQLAHQEQNAIRRAYTHGAEYWDERTKMMQAWADYLDDLQENKKSLLSWTQTANGPGSVAPKTDSLTVYECEQLS